MNRNYRRAFRRLFNRVYLKQTVGSTRRGSAVSMYLSRRGSAVNAYLRKPRASVPHTAVTNMDLLYSES